MKTRHNVTISPEIWHILQELKRIRGQSASELLEDAVMKMIRAENLNPAFFRLMGSADFCDAAENAELTALLDSLTSDDLEPVIEIEL